MFESGVDDLALAQVVAAGKTFSPKQIHGSVDGGKIDGLGLFSQFKVDFFD